MKAFEEFLQTHLPKLDTIHPHLEKALVVMMQSGGKRFRPALLLAVVQAYEPLLVKSAYHAALAIESLHTYSLIHDDLPAMDDADLRRGVATLHNSYDEVTAVLAGDALNTYAFELLSLAPLSSDVRIALVKSLAVNGGISGMIIGQAVDCHFENQVIALEDLKTLHINKTAKLIAASLEMGAIIVKNMNLAQELYDFGIDLGLLFQIQDDILDVKLSDEEAGKSTGVDGDKNSFVNLLGLKAAEDEANRLANRLEAVISGLDSRLQKTLKPLLAHYLYRHKV